MKKVCFAFSLFVAFVVAIICANRVYGTNNRVNPNTPTTPTKTDVISLDKVYRVSDAEFDGHEYLLFESGERGEEGYAFFLDHKSDCKVCCEQFD